MINKINFKGKRVYHFILLGVFFTLFNACKENTVLPPDLVPAVDNINTFQTDTFTIFSRTIVQDSLHTGGKLNTFSRSADDDFMNAIGTITNDPVFGKTVASTYFQVVQPSPAFTFAGSNQDIDSIVISLNYKDAFGDTMSAPMQTFSLYRTSDNLPLDSAYYSNSQVNYSATDLLATDMVDFNTISSDSAQVDGVKVAPRISFQLPSVFGDSLLAQTASGAFLNFSSFKEWLGGFYITPDSNTGNTLGYFDTYNASMTVYYRYIDGNNDPDTTTAVFPFDATYTNRFNRITRTFAGSPANNYINSSNLDGDSLVFIQSEPGLTAELSFPYIDQFPNAIINKAELIFTVVSPITNFTDTTNFNTPDQIQILVENEDGEDEILEDYAVLGTAWVGGEKEYDLVNGVSYTRYAFNLNHTFQNAVTRMNNDFKFKMSGLRSNFPGRHRVVVAGGNYSDSLEKMKLNIIFTKIQ